MKAKCTHCGKTVEMEFHSSCEGQKSPTLDNVIWSKLLNRGVFKGFHGLEGLLECQEFWDKQPYGTRLYYGDGIADYLHRDVLKVAIDILKQEEE